MRFKFVRNATLATILEISIEGNRSSSRMKGRRITFIYSLYHDHSIKRSVSSRDDRSSHWQHPHVVSQSFAICGNCRGGLRITEGLESRGSLQSRTSLDSPISPFSPLRLLLSIVFLTQKYLPSFLSFLSFLFFSIVLFPSKQACLFLILTSARWDFSFKWNCFEGKLREFLYLSFCFCKHRNLLSIDIDKQG